MTILEFKREEGGCAGSAKIRLTEMEVRAISNLLYREDKPNDIVGGLNKDFFTLRELLHHGGFDRPAIEILCKTAKMERKIKNENQ